MAGSGKVRIYRVENGARLGPYFETSAIQGWNGDGHYDSQVRPSPYDDGIGDDYWGKHERYGFLSKRMLWRWMYYYRRFLKAFVVGVYEGPKDAHMVSKSRRQVVFDITRFNRIAEEKLPWMK